MSDDYRNPKLGAALLTLVIAGTFALVSLVSLATWMRGGA